MTTKKRRFLLRWHWRIGITSVIFLLLLATTGLALNHARHIGLDQIYIDTEWILSLYNMDLPPDVPQDMAEQYRGKGITLERLILDIHSGNIIGLPGKIISDLAALAIIFLCLSGLYNLWKRKKS